VELTRSGGSQTIVRTSYTSAEFLTGLRAETPVAPPAEISSPVGRIDPRKIALPQNAKQVTYNSAEEKLTFVSARQVQFLVEYFRREFEDWKEDRRLSIVNESIGDVVLGKGDLRLSLNFIRTSSESDTEATLSGNALAWNKGNPPTDSVAVKPAADQIAEPAPAALPKPSPNKPFQN